MEKLFYFNYSNVAGGFVHNCCAGCRLPNPRKDLFPMRLVMLVVTLAQGLLFFGKQERYACIPGFKARVSF
jgi:hypothetical protein